jgi:tRNA (cmo5U34)-methyltransferase
MHVIIWHVVHARKNSNLWQLPEHALTYLAQADAIPHRAEGEAVLLEFLPPRLCRVLDLGCGDGRLLALVRLVHPHLQGVALDFSDAMLQRLEERFATDPSVEVVRHDLDAPLPPLHGLFDAAVPRAARHC